MNHRHSFFPSVIALLAALLTTPLTAQIITRPITTEGDSGVVLVSFIDGGHLDARAGRLAVVDANGKNVLYRLLSHDPEGQTWLAIDLTGKSTPLSIRYGPDPMPNIKLDEKIQPSLVLQVFPLPHRSFSGLTDVMDSLASVPPMGTMLIDNIDLGYNPFGPSENFVAVFDGLIQTDQEETDRLFSVNHDAAFVEIDGKTIIAQPMAVVLQKPEKLAAISVPVQFTAGTHHVRYVQLQTSGASIALLGHMIGDHARPLDKTEFVHTSIATLGPAVSDNDKKPAIGFDAAQVDQLEDGGATFSRFALTPIAPAPTGTHYHWNFGDNTASPSPTPSLSGGRVAGVPAGNNGALHHVYVLPTKGYPTWRVTLELLDAREKPLGQAVAVIRPTIVSKAKSIRSTKAMAGYVAAIAQANYDKTDAEIMASLYSLAATTERPTAVAPIAEPFLRRFGDRGGDLVREMKNMLALYLSRDDPKRAAELFGELGRSAKDSWAGTCAIAEQMDLMTFRLNAKPQEIRALMTQVFENRTPRERALLKARIGDAYRFEGKVDEATAAYREAQAQDARLMEPRKAAVLERAHRETALSNLKQERYPALRDELFQWEADFPMASLGGDLPLLSGRYFQAIGDDPRAAVEFQTMLKLNPLHPSLPEITFRLGQSLWRMGKKDEAKKLFAKVAKDYPNSPFADASWNAPEQLDAELNNADSGPAGDDTDDDADE